MFDDRFGLTRAVKDGLKTMTRRIIPAKDVEYILGEFKQEYFDATLDMLDDDRAYFEQYYLIEKCGRCFRPGQVVAVAQRYRDFNWPEPRRKDFQEIRRSAGWNNKMFVRSDLMPTRILIEEVRFERLQEITDEDCIREGITTKTEGKYESGNGYGWDTYIDALKRNTFFTPRAAFSALIDRMAGKGAWCSNPWVFVYGFKKIKL